jgi:hypothetical protein
MNQQEIEKLHSSTLQVHNMVDKWLPAEYKVKDKEVKEHVLYQKSKLVGRLVSEKKKTDRAEKIEKVERERVGKKKRRDPLAKYMS